RPDAIRLAKRNIEAFEATPLDAIVVDAAGCGAHLKAYGHLLHDDAEWAARAAAFSTKVRDITEYLASLPGAAPLGTLPMRATYQEPCHLVHAQRMTAAPRALLRRLAGLPLIELAESDVCRGSAGWYNLQQPAMADALLARKVNAI